MGMAGDR